jgi:uncharacterized RDD family membrane protein YckC
VGSRIAAYFIDWLILGIAGFALFAACVALGDAGQQALAGILILVIVVAAGFVIPGLWAADRLGSSPGKNAMKIAVVGMDGRPIGAWRGLLRQFVLVIGAALFYIGWLVGLGNPLRQTWHDQAANSLVVKRSAVVAEVPETLPDGQMATGPSCPVCGFPLGPSGKCSVCGATA